MKRKIRILLVDDHALIRMGLKSLIGFQPDMEVVGEAEDGAAAVAAVATHSPDVVMMDLMMPQSDGVEATRKILSMRPDTKVLILTSYGTSAALARALKCGAAGAQMKETPPKELLSAIRKVYAGGKAIAPEISAYMTADPVPPELTDHQTAILHGLTRGLSNQDIAQQMGISAQTVKKLLNTIFTKLDVSTRAEAVAVAMRRHLLGS